MEKDVLKAINKLDQILKPIREMNPIETPSKGWISELRSTFNITTKRLGNKIDKPVTAQAILDLEKHEVSGTISLNTLRKAGRAMNMKLVYCFIPEDETVYS